MTDRPEIRYLGDVQRLALQPGDIVVLKASRHLDQETAGRLRQHMTEMVGDDHKIIILGDGLEIGVLGPEST